MKKLFYLMLLLVSVASMYADNYKILWMNTQNIKIGGRVCGVDSVFSDLSGIMWSKSGQAIKAQNLKTKEIAIFVEPEFKKHNSKSIVDYYIKTNHMSTRSTPPTEDELKAQLSNTFYMLEEICIKGHAPIDSNQYYVIKYEKDGNMIEKMLTANRDSFVIPRSLFASNDGEDKKEVRLSVYFRDSQAEENLLLTDSMIIQILPLEYKTRVK